MYLMFVFSGSDITAKLDKQKAQELKDKEQQRMADTAGSGKDDTTAVSKTTKTETGPGGDTTTTSITTTTHKTQGM